MAVPVSALITVALVETSELQRPSIIAIDGLRALRHG